jgi:Sortilin, neurotensin receptor 3,
VYVAVDNHRQNDYEPYLWLSTDYGATFRAIVNGLAGENVRTVTEDTRNRDVLYVGTETGLFVTLDRGASWRRLKANLPTVRIDELTIHPRDNALLVATHGRALWILDHLEPIQEYASLASREAALVTPGFTLQWKYKDDRNDEFWGHQFFTGENPPDDAVIPFYLKAPLGNARLRISDGGRRVVRELVIPDSRNRPGLQTMCWDQRLEPIAPLPVRRQAGGAGGPGGGPGAGRRPIPGIPEPLPPVGYKADSPCPPPDTTAAGGGGGGGGFGGGTQYQGPLAVPGTYTVALVADGRVLDSKPLRLTMDPAVQLTGGDRVRYNGIVADLHEFHRRGVDAARPLATLYDEVLRVVPRVDSSSAPAAMKSEWSAFRAQFDSVRVRFGVPAAAGGGFGGGAAAQAAATANVLGRVGQLKGQLQGTWELPSAGLMRQVNAARSELSTAMLQVRAVLERARAVARSLARAGVTMTVPD